jgi:hypothetical protein
MLTRFELHHADARCRTPIAPHAPEACRSTRGPLRRPSYPASRAAPTRGRLRWCCARRHVPFQGFLYFANPEPRSTAACAPSTRLPDGPRPELTSPPAPSTRTQSKQREIPANSRNDARPESNDQGAA